VRIIKEKLLIIQELYNRSLSFKDERWSKVLLPVYNELLKKVDRRELRAEYIRGLE